MHVCSKKQVDCLIQKYLQADRPLRHLPCHQEHHPNPVEEQESVSDVISCI